MSYKLERPNAEEDWARQSRQWHTKRPLGGPGRGIVVSPHWQTAFIFVATGAPSKDYARVYALRLWRKCRSLRNVRNVPRNSGT
jgi:hypothetical protein